MYESKFSLTTHWCNFDFLHNSQTCFQTVMYGLNIKDLVFLQNPPCNFAWFWKEFGDKTSQTFNLLGAWAWKWHCLHMLPYKTQGDIVMKFHMILKCSRIIRHGLYNKDFICWQNPPWNCCKFSTIIQTVFRL